MAGPANHMQAASHMQGRRGPAKRLQGHAPPCPAMTAVRRCTVFDGMSWGRAPPLDQMAAMAVVVMTAVAVREVSASTKAIGAADAKPPRCPR